LQRTSLRTKLSSQDLTEKYDLGIVTIGDIPGSLWDSPEQYDLGIVTIWDIPGSVGQPRTSLESIHDLGHIPPENGQDFDCHLHGY